MICRRFSSDLRRPSSLARVSACPMVSDSWFVSSESYVFKIDWSVQRKSTKTRKKDKLAPKLGENEHGEVEQREERAMPGCRKAQRMDGAHRVGGGRKTTESRWIFCGNGDRNDSVRTLKFSTATQEQRQPEAIPVNDASNAPERETKYISDA